MDEGRRREYLKVMGIAVWERRDALPAEDRGVAPEPSAGASQDPLLHGQADGDDARTSRQHEPTAKTPALERPPLQRTRERADASTGSAWDELRRTVKSCTLCGLRAGCTQTVFGTGNTQADLLIIGEAPGADEDRQGEPFVGRAGQLLNAMLLAMGLKREQVFIANILKCRPPGNRDPSPQEAMQCAPFLLRQFELIRPRVILSAGRISAQNLLNTGIAVGKLRGRVHPFGEQRIPLVVTYHPAYLLRSPEQKAKAWDDLQLVLSLLRGATP